MSITYDRYDVYAHDIVAFFFCMISYYALAGKKSFNAQNPFYLESRIETCALLKKRF